MPATFTAFAGHLRLADGSIDQVAEAVANYGDALPLALIIDDATGRTVDLNLRDGVEAAVADYRARTGPDAPPPRQGRGRPKLGVVAREVTLLPRHWDWLATRPGGASAALRRLVEEARRAEPGPDRHRQLRDAAYRAMSVLAGDLPGFEEASRALFADDADKLHAHMADWPADIQAFVARLTTYD